MSRRQVLAAAAGATAGCLAAHALAAVPGANETSPEARPRAGAMKVGLYSITFLGLWYRGKGLSLDEVVRRAKQHGYDGVEIDGKRPHGNPLDWPKRRCQELRKAADGQGIDLYAVAANNDFSSPIPEHRECQVAYVRELLRMAADMGAKTLRVFLAWAGVTRHPQLGRYDISRPLWETVHKSFSREEIWAWCREGLIETARYAADYGVTLALQNHNPVITDHRDVLRMVREVNSPSLKVCLDGGIMPDRRPETLRQAAADVGALQVLSHFGGEFDRGADGMVRLRMPAAAGKDPEPDCNPAFVRAMRAVGYQGYIGYELCHPLPVVNGQTVGIEYAEENARLACEYMRGLIHAQRAKTAG
jgi:sugar phosphate isomerase/epimerase